MTGPFLWGSKRTGPDLHRIGGKYTDVWQRMHLLDPRTVVPDSIMPGYPWLGERAADADGSIQSKMRALRRLGHPYTDAEIEAAPPPWPGSRRWMLWWPTCRRCAHPLRRRRRDLVHFRRRHAGDGLHGGARRLGACGAVPTRRSMRRLEFPCRMNWTACRTIPAMAELPSAFWSGWVAVITVASLIASFG